MARRTRYGAVIASKMERCGAAVRQKRRMPRKRRYLTRQEFLAKIRSEVKTDAQFAKEHDDFQLRLKLSGQANNPQFMKKQPWTTSKTKTETKTAVKTEVKQEVREIKTKGIEILMRKNTRY